MTPTPSPAPTPSPHLAVEHWNALAADLIPRFAPPPHPDTRHPFRAPLSDCPAFLRPLTHPDALILVTLTEIMSPGILFTAAEPIELAERVELVLDPALDAHPAPRLRITACEPDAPAAGARYRLAAILETP